MENKNRFRGIMFFLAGLLTAFVLQFSITDPKDVLADQYSCIRQDLHAYGMTGNIPDPSFSITYNVPSCYSANGYTVEKVYMYGNQVAVKYKNPNATSGLKTGPLGGKGSGGLNPIP